MLTYNILKTEGKARRGVLRTAHGDVNTPAFMPVGTVGTVKAMMPESVASTGAEILLGNTYHLMLRPGAERVAAFGGLHKFMNWPKPILTDSGGFQVMSLSGLRKITEDGVTFQSHLSGEKFFLTPERSMEIQYLLDSDITMAFDECVKLPAPHKKVADSMRRSMRWAKRSKEAFKDRKGYGLFGIVQGGTYQDNNGSCCPTGYTRSEEKGCGPWENSCSNYGEIKDTTCYSTCTSITPTITPSGSYSSCSGRWEYYP